MSAQSPGRFNGTSRQGGRSTLPSRAIIITAMMVAVIAMLLYPPFEARTGGGQTFNRGYSWIFSPPDGAYGADASVNVPLLLTQFGAVAVVGGLSILLLRVLRTDRPLAHQGSSELAESPPTPNAEGGTRPVLREENGQAPGLPKHRVRNALVGLGVVLVALLIASVSGVLKIVRSADPKAHTHYTLKSSDAGTVRIEYASAKWVGKRAVATVEYEFRDGSKQTVLFAASGCSPNESSRQLTAFNTDGTPIRESAIDWSPDGGQIPDAMGKAICAFAGPK